MRSFGTAGLLHDIGKIRIPRDVLTKPGKLTDEERAIMQEHPVEGARVTLQQSLERASTCIRIREREGPILSSWLREQSAGSRP